MRRFDGAVTRVSNSAADLIWTVRSAFDSLICLPGNIMTRPNTSLHKGWLVQLAVVVVCCPPPAASSIMYRQEVQPTTFTTGPIDMRLPCTGQLPCKTNVDVDAAPRPPRATKGLRSCGVELMPWSPFPCTFDSAQYAGIPGQQQNLCYDSTTHMPSPLARRLTTDGYSNIFEGVLPNSWEQFDCSTKQEDGGVSSSSDGAGPQAAGQPTSQGQSVERVLLTIDFRIAAGRQFDRTYSLQLGAAVAALGTCTEASRWMAADKAWRAVFDVTHLQAYLRPGMPTRFSLANVLTNTYTVPLWSRAQLDVFYSNSPASLHSMQQQLTGLLLPSPSSPAVPDEFLPLVPDLQQRQRQRQQLQQKLRLQQQQQQQQPGREQPGGWLRWAHEQLLQATEQLQLQQQLDMPDSLVSLSGSGDGPANWPNITFNLPAQLSAAGNIYRAQLQVTPKANGCEEFWLINPSGNKTGSSCGGLSTGEPARELRVYVDGQLAGFSPIRYTMYTGGVDPRLWSAIVSQGAYKLPTFTFDLSPWLGILNTPDQQQQQQQQQAAGQPAAATASAAASAEQEPQQGTARRDGRSGSSRLPRIRPRPAGGSAGAAVGGHNITVELYGATGSDWILANSLLLWRAAAAPDEPPRAAAVTALSPPVVATSASLSQPVESSCSSSGGDLAVAGRCEVLLQRRVLAAEAVLLHRGVEYVTSVRYANDHMRSLISYDNDAGSSEWQVTTAFSAAWLMAALEPSGAGQAALGEGQQQKRRRLLAGELGAAGGNGRGSTHHHHHHHRVVTQSMRSEEWLNAGAIAPRAPFEVSNNLTLLVPTVLRSIDCRGSTGPDSRPSPPAAAAAAAAVWVQEGRQRHYQRALMLDVYNPAQPDCAIPGIATHTASLNSSITESVSVWGEQRGHGHGEECETFQASAAFCSAALLSMQQEVLPGGC